MSAIGAEAITLLHAVRQHETGICDAANTVFAVFGVASPQGRIVDRFGFVNPPFTMWLDEAAYDHGASDQAWHDRDTPAPRSAAAEKMREHELHCSVRGNLRRKLPITEAARNALLEYYGEKLELMTKVGELLVKARALYPYRRSALRRHIKSCEKLCQSLRA